MINVGLMGFGRAGRAVSTVLLQSENVCLQWVVRRSKVLEHRSVSEFLGLESTDPAEIFRTDELSAAELLRQRPVDVLVDFSGADGLDWYGEAAAQQQVAIVSAISGYGEAAQARLRELAQRTRVMWSPNITIGVNFLILAARVLKKIAPWTDVEIIEEHFRQKQEVSGTAKKIADSLEIPRDQIKTIRAGGIVGTHEILFGFPYQTVRLKHESIAREAFGNGALFAATHLVDRKTGFYTMEDLLLPYFAL